jgi:phenylpropionate dioxygenase-like ring-hydroxylating dioxygenase large terminal subunit
LDGSLPQDDVDTAFVEIEDQLESFKLGSYRFLARQEREVSANWKLVNDLSLESYHFNTLHRGSIGQLLAPNAVIDTYNRHSRWAFPLQSLGQLKGTSEADWPNILQGSCTFTLYPGVMFIFNALGAQMIRAEPGATPDRSRVVYVGVALGDCDLEEARRAFELGGNVFFGEDIPVVEQCQAGLGASERELLLGSNEPLLQFWHRLWSRALHSAPARVDYPA